jgi:hypothetical protein
MMAFETQEQSASFGRPAPCFVKTRDGRWLGRRASFGLVVHEVIARFEITREQFDSKSRKRNLVHARQATMMWARALVRTNGASISYPKIAGRLGFLDHTTIMFGVRAGRARWQAGTDRLWRLDMEALQARFEEIAEHA